MAKDIMTSGIEMSDVIKATGFPVPEGMEGKTFASVVEEGAGVELEDNKTVSITENGTVEITPSEGKDAMKKVTATVSVSGGGADIEANKSATINVSSYTEPVEITPTVGKDGMAKATVTLTNIPSGGDVTAYAWVNGSKITYLPVSVAPTDTSELAEKCAVGGGVNNSSYFMIVPFATLYTDYVKVSDTEFTASLAGLPQTFTRDLSKDFTLWKVN